MRWERFFAIHCIRFLWAISCLCMVWFWWRSPRSWSLGDIGCGKWCLLLLFIYKKMLRGVRNSKTEKMICVLTLFNQMHNVYWSGLSSPEAEFTYAFFNSSFSYFSTSAYPPPTRRQNSNWWTETPVWYIEHVVFGMINSNNSSGSSTVIAFGTKYGSIETYPFDEITGKSL